MTWRWSLKNTVVPRLFLKKLPLSLSLVMRDLRDKPRLDVRRARFPLCCGLKDSPLTFYIQRILFSPFLAKNTKEALNSTSKHFSPLTSWRLYPKAFEHHWSPRSLHRPPRRILAPFDGPKERRQRHLLDGVLALVRGRLKNWNGGTRERGVIYIYSRFCSFSLDEICFFVLDNKTFAWKFLDESLVVGERFFRETKSCLMYFFVIGICFWKCLINAFLFKTERPCGFLFGSYGFFSDGFIWANWPLEVTEDPLHLINLQC